MYQNNPNIFGRLRLKCDGTRAETRFRLSAKRTSSFKSAEESVQSTTGSRGVRVSGSNGSNAGYTEFRGSVKREKWLPTPFASFPFASSPVRHRVPSHFNWPVQHRERLLASVTSSSVPSLLHLNCQRTFNKPSVISRRGLHTESFKRENG